MKKTKEFNSITYKTFNGFYIDIVQRKNDMYDSWIYQESYGIKMYMFGMEIGTETGCKTYNEFLSIVENNLEEYINIYREEYMDE